MSITIKLSQDILNKLLRNEDFAVESVYVSLHSDAPGEDGANEVGLSRPLVLFDSAIGGQASNSEDLEWRNMPKVTVRYIGLWDRPLRGGRLLWSGKLTSAEQVNAGNTFLIPKGNLLIGLG